MAEARHVLFHRPPVNSNWLNIPGLGIEAPGPPTMVDRPAGTADCLFMCFLHKAQVSEQGRAAPRPSPCLILWKPGQPQRYGRADGPYLHSWLHCNGQLVHRLIHELRLPLDRVITPTDESLFHAILRSIYHELTEQAEPDPVIVGNHIENWLRSVARRLRDRDPPRPVPTAMLELKQHLDATFARPHRLQQIAKRVHLSVPHLSTLFKQYFGVSPIQYVIRARLGHAAHLLRDRNLSVTQIGRRVGYDDVYHFSKLFKKHHGVSPLEMREKIFGK